MPKPCKTEWALQRRKLLSDSLLALMRTRSYSQISVKDICEEAPIPRRTFYHYFDDKDDVLNTVIEDTLLPCFLAAMFDFDSGYDALKQSFIRFFHSFNQESRERLCLLLDNKQESRLIAYASEWASVERIQPAQRENLTPKFIDIARLIGSAGFFSLLFYWCRNGFQESPEEMAEYIVWFLTEPLFKA